MLNLPVLLELEAVMELIAAIKLKVPKLAADPVTSTWHVLELTSQLEIILAT